MKVIEHPWGWQVTVQEAVDGTVLWGHVPQPVLLLLACWPIIAWYGRGTIDGSNDPWGRQIAIDAPCSGVRVLWAASYLMAAAAALFRFDLRQTTAAVALTLAVVIAANAVRVAAPFYLEAGLQRDFPGRVGRFTDGRREIVLRWVTRETRNLHASSDCFKANGYRVKAMSIKRVGEGR